MVSVSVLGFKKYRISGIGYFFKGPNIWYCRADPTLAGMAKYFHTSVLE